jgi:ABC-type Zn2+ transport system substrate-binding protein/surface adhesin
LLLLLPLHRQDASRLQLPDLRNMMNLVKQNSSSNSSSLQESTQEGSQDSCCDHDHSSGHHHHHHHHHHHDSHSHSHSHAAAADDKLTEQQASLLVKYNAFADDYEDLAAAAVRGAAMPHSHVGLWPQFALFNHACLPNTVHYLVGHAMVVRAVEDVPAGGDQIFRIQSAIAEEMDQQQHHGAACGQPVRDAVTARYVLLVFCSSKSQGP